MPKTVRNRLADTLEDLGQDELKRFKRKVNECSVRRGYDNIPKGRLEKADALDLADLLISFYAEDYSVTLTAGVLEEINCKPQAQRLLSSIGTTGGSSSQISVPSISATAGGNGRHFVERHREELVLRTAPVEPVLDRLHGTVLTEEQYQKICANGTNQDKMRELYRLMPSWNNFCKDQLYEALKAKNPYLIDDLEGR